MDDHARAIDVIFHRGKKGEKYNIGGFNEWKNIDLVHLLCSVMDKKLGRKEGESAKLITFVKDRAGHDMRYAIGVGLRYKLPIGPIRLDYGVNPDPRPFEDFGAFHFSFGFAF